MENKKVHNLKSRFICVKCRKSFNQYEVLESKKTELYAEIRIKNNKLLMIPIYSKKICIDCLNNPNVIKDLIEEYKEILNNAIKSYKQKEIK